MRIKKRRRGFKNFAALAARFSSETMSTLEPSTQRVYVRSLARLVEAFREWPLEAIQPADVLEYHSDLAKHSKALARQDVQVIRAVFSAAVGWGRIAANPLKGQLRIPALRPRMRYVTDEEISRALPHATEWLRAYVKLKLATGARKSDLLRLTDEDVLPAGLLIRPRKTAKTTGVQFTFEWSEDLVDTVKLLQRLRPAGAASLLSTRAGHSFIQPDGQANTFDKAWSRWQHRCLDAGALTERFQERDLRAKVASDSASLEDASARLGHSSTTITQRVYRRRARVIKPLAPTEEKP